MTKLQSVIEDEAVTRARDEIIRLLLSAGYFRVRMPDLQDFEKISGGLAWGLKSSSVDVDVNIFFKEKPNVGEKIRISESICAGLRALKSPYELKPHQVQGLDFKALFPVIQWLVRKVIETRNEFGDFQKNYAEFSFNNRYANLPTDVLLKEHAPVSRSNIRQVERFFPPKRFYRRGVWDTKLAEVKQLETTLLEYGRIPSAIGAQTGKQTRAGAAEEDNDADQKRKEELKATLSGMNRDDGETALDGNLISGMMGEQSGYFKSMPGKATAKAASADAEYTDLTEKQMRDEHAKRMEALNARIAQMKAEGRKLNEEYQKIAAELEELTEKYNAAADENARLKALVKKYMRTIEGAEHTEDLLRAIRVRDDAVAAVEKFQAQCLQEKKEWEEKIAELREQVESDNSGNDDKLKEMLAQYQKEWEKIQANVAVKAREVLKLQTDYDQVPSLAELTQYDRRLQELSTLELAKLTELKKCHQLCGALIDSEDVLSKENELFNSLLDSFDAALGQSSLKDKMMKQMETIAKETTARQSKCKRELDQKRAHIASLDAKHRGMLEQQRRYFQAVKEYQIAYETLSKLKGDEDEDLDLDAEDDE